MGPFIIGIGGAHSKVGKTGVACQLLRSLSGWGAIKYTKTSFYSSIVDSPEILRQKNKDTYRLLNAGAQAVLWVQSPREDLKEVLGIAVDKLTHLEGIILEGNSAIEAIKPDVVIFVSGNEGMKRGAEKILGMADAVIFDKDPPQGTPEKAKRFSLDDTEGYVNFITGLIVKRENKKKLKDKK
jgi:molybdopterin-guanine dinucleotide biosynthesis protein